MRAAAAARALAARAGRSRQGLRARARARPRPSGGAPARRAATTMGPPLPATSLTLGRALGSPAALCTLGVFQDFTCPFSARLWRRLMEDVKPKYVDTGKLRIAFHHQVQPWHPTSTLCHEASLAVGRVGGDEAFWKFVGALATLEGFDANTDAATFGDSREQTYERLATLAEKVSGVSKAAVLELLRLDPEAIASGQRNPGTLVTNELKLQVKFGRQMGVHVSPTTTWNGLVCDTSSGWSAVEWAAFLDPLLEKAAQA